jgi:dienelactone hydrolase
MPAVCLAPGLALGLVLGEQSMAALAHRLAQEGMVAFVIHPDEESYAYPGILAVLPAAMAALGKRPDVDPGRLAVLGYDLGGDLVIRAASTCKPSASGGDQREIKAVAALAPVLADVPAGLDLLREMSYFRAMRWARDRKRTSLRKELNAIEYGAKIFPRPFLLLYGEEDRLVADAPLAKWAGQHRDSIDLQVIPGTGHLNLADHPMAVRVIIQWFKEHL